MSTMRSTNEAKQAGLSSVPAESLRPDTNSFHHSKMQPPLLIRYDAAPFQGGEACSKGILRWF
jgi:hypothetical protein